MAVEVKINLIRMDCYSGFSFVSLEIYPDMRQDRKISDVIEILEEIGLTDLVHRKNKHHVIKGTLNGVSFNWTVSSTPSNQNSNKAAAASLRRELRKCGLESPPKFTTMNFTSFPTEKEVLTKKLFALLKQLELPEEN